MIQKLNQTPQFTIMLVFLTCIILLISCRRDGLENPERELSIIDFSKLNVDSLIVSWERTKDIKEQIDLSLFLVEKLYTKNTLKARKLAEHSYQLSVKKGSDFKTAKSLYWVALIKKQTQFFGEGTEDPIVDANISLTLFRELDEALWVAKAYNLIGIMFENQDLLKQARIYQDSALLSLNQLTLTDKPVISLSGEIYHDLGTTYLNEDTMKAMNFYKKAKSYYIKADNSTAKARLNLDIGKLIKKYNNFDDANVYFNKSLEYAITNNDIDLLIQTYETLSDLRLREYELFADNGFIYDSLFQQGVTYAEKMVPLMTESYFRPYQKLGLIYHYRWIYNDETDDLNSALKYYNKAFESATEEGQIALMVELSSDIQTLCSNPKSPCFEAFTESFSASQYAYIQGFYHNKKTQSDAEKKRWRFEFDKLDQENKENRFQLISGAGIFILLLIIIFLVFYQRVLRQRLEAKIEALRAQINPHFISNTINAIEGLVNYDKKEEAAEALADFAQLMRSILSGSRKGAHTLSREQAMLKSYLELLKLRFEEKFNYTIRIDPEITPDLTQLPAMVVQPFVENAILHGINAKDDVGHVEIRFSRIEKYLLIEVDDDGVGRAATKKDQAKSVLDHESHGMAITRERIDAISQTKDTKVTIIDKEIDGKVLGTTVQIRLPFQEIDHV